jgi:hypothetical protein
VIVLPVRLLAQRYQSGEIDLTGQIAKCGDEFVRTKLMVNIIEPAVDVMDRMNCTQNVIIAIAASGE